MSEIRRVICPVDLSDNSRAAIELATTIAESHGAKLNFIYVAPQWLPEESMFGSEYVRGEIADEKTEFMKLRPVNENVEYEHTFLQGNAGPEIVRTAKPNDMIVMSTHGYSGIMRLVMGSVAQYVLRNAKCATVLIRTRSFKARTPDVPSEEQPADAKEVTEQTITDNRYVTELMRQVAAVHNYNAIKQVAEELDKANESAAPVIDELHKCIGILTSTDIDRYNDLLRRLDERDESVIDEVYKTDKFGLRRMNNSEFHQVKRHMTTPVVTITNVETCERARELFETHTDIHHLVVVDELNQPVGIIGSADLGASRLAHRE